MAETKIVKKHQVALFMNGGTKQAPSWVREEKATAFSLATNPVTQEYDYIVDETPTTELDHYAPSLNQPLTMYKGNPDYELVFPKFFNMAVGSEANVPLLLVFYQEPVDGETPHTRFKAWHAPNARLVVETFDSVASTITFTVYLNGGIEKGYAEITGKIPAFTEGEYGAANAPAKFTVTFDADGGTGTDPEDAEVEVGGTYRLPANPYEAPADKHFKAWEIGGAEYSPGDDISVTDDTIVKAVWEDD